MDSYLKSLFGLKGKIGRIKEILRGFLRDPLLCLGTISSILFLFVCLGSSFISDSPLNSRDFSMASILESSEESIKEEAFAGLVKKSWPDSPEFLLLADNSLKAAIPPSSFSSQILGALVGGYDFDDAKNTITEYIVEPGDSLSGIASKFSISLNTILWANGLNSRSFIQPGQKLVLLPVSGVLHHIKSGDTISEIAKIYKGKADEIIAFNDLSSEGDIYVGDIVIVPNGQKPKSSYQPSVSPLANSYFICPIAGCAKKITQGLHWYNAIDFSSGKCGEVIYAAAAGDVLKVKLTSSTSKWAFNGYGNHMTILHPNGVVTYYGHISVSLVNPGDQVSQGQAIALMGGSPGTAGAGNSTGCHLHFGVSGARNPFAY